MITKIEAVRLDGSYAYNVTSSEQSDVNSILYSYFGSTISPSQFDAMLKRYGIIATGNVDLDARTLYKAMYSAASNLLENNIQSAAASAEKPKLPWNDIMAQVGINPTGDLNTDRGSFYDRISAMQASAANDSNQTANINLLLAEAGVVFVSMAAQEQKTASAAEIKALVNKQFFFGGSLSSF